MPSKKQLNSGSEEMLKITDTDTASDFPLIGTRFYGQKIIPGNENRCSTTLWKSLGGFPHRYLGTYELAIEERNNQNQRWFISGVANPKPKNISAKRVEDNFELKNWVYQSYWLPAAVGGLVLLLLVIYSSLGGR